MSQLTEKYLWIEKYRPHTLDDVVLPPDYERAFRTYLNENKSI